LVNNVKIIEPPSGENSDLTVPSTAQGPLSTPRSLPNVANAVSTFPTQAHIRTPGLRLFDVFLYPFLTNFVVFGISVAATYLTNKGGMRNAEGKLIYGKIGKWFHTRGDWVTNKFKKIGMNHEQADMSKMVFFSFADGTLVAPMVKLLEDRREKISKWIDDRLGTTPEDEVAAYKAEPKQSWLSVIGGRLAVAAIVAPTAAFLDKTGLNHRLFNEPGKKIGEWIASKPNVAKRFGKWDVKELGRVSAFEAFYTSVCTAGLYVISRFLARNTGKKKTGEMESILDDNKKDFAPGAIPANTITKRVLDSEEPPAKSYTKSITPSSERITKEPSTLYTQKLADSAAQATEVQNAVPSRPGL